MGKVVSLAGSKYESIPVESIVEDDFLPRKQYSAEALDELRKSINEQGMMHTVLVTSRGDGKYSLVVGSRRLRAARKSGYTHIHACISDKNSKVDIILTALAENAQREPLEPLEEANAFLLLASELDVPLDQIAKGISKSRAYIVNRLKLLDLTEDVQRLIAEGIIPASTAVKLAHISSGEEQLRIAKVVIEEKLNADEVVGYIRDENSRYVKRGTTLREMTVVKYSLQIRHLTEKIRTDFALIESLSMTPEERGDLFAIHVALEKVSNDIRNRLSSSGRVVFSKDKITSQGNAHRTRNHGDEWPAGDLTHFDNMSLSNAEIAKLTGRSENAVRGMRAKYRQSKKLK